MAERFPWTPPPPRSEAAEEPRKESRGSTASRVEESAGALAAAAGSAAPTRVPIAGRAATELPFVHSATLKLHTVLVKAFGARLGLAGAPCALACAFLGRAGIAARGGIDGARFANALANALRRAPSALGGTGLLRRTTIAAGADVLRGARLAAAAAAAASRVAAAASSIAATAAAAQASAASCSSAAQPGASSARGGRGKSSATALSAEGAVDGCILALAASIFELVGGDEAVIRTADGSD